MIGKSLTVDKQLSKLLSEDLIELKVKKVMRTSGFNNYFVRKKSINKSPSNTCKITNNSQLSICMCS